MVQGAAFRLQSTLAQVQILPKSMNIIFYGTFCIHVTPSLLLILALSYIEVHFVKRMFDATHSDLIDERQSGSHTGHGEECHSCI